MRKSAVTTGIIYLDVFIDNDSERQSVCENIELSFISKQQSKGYHEIPETYIYLSSSSPGRSKAPSSSFPSAIFVSLVVQGRPGVFTGSRDNARRAFRSRTLGA
jgi:hypothetical protein